MTAARIAKGSKFPPRFLYRVLRRLVDAGLMSGTSGPGGGYALAKPAGKITLREIVAAVEGPQRPAPLAPVNTKQRHAIKFINDLSERNVKRFEQDLGRVTLAKLSKL